MLEDLDFGFRLRELGMTLVYCPEAVGIHACPMDTLDKVIESGKRYGRTLAEWGDRLPMLGSHLDEMGGSIGGGWRNFLRSPADYLKCAVRRAVVNAATVRVLEQIVRRARIDAPPEPLLARCCREIWSFHFRNEYRRVLGDRVRSETAEACTGVDCLG